METYWIFHLAASWGGSSPALNPSSAIGSVFPPAATSSHAETAHTALNRSQPAKETTRQPMIRAAAVQMVFASRSSSGEFITPDHVSKLEAWCGQAVLDALCAMNIPQDVRVNDSRRRGPQHMTNTFDWRSNYTPRKGAFGTWRVLLWKKHREAH